MPADVAESLRSNWLATDLAECFCHRSLLFHCRSDKTERSIGIPLVFSFPTGNAKLNAELQALSPAPNSLLNSSSIGQRSLRLLIPEDAIFALYVSIFIDNAYAILVWEGNLTMTTMLRSGLAIGFQTDVAVWPPDSGVISWLIDFHVRKHECAQQ
jgi:hypothetical protein